MSITSEKLKLFKKIDKHLSEDVKPSIYLNKVSSNSLFSEYPFSILYRLKTIEQSPKHHPEGNVWNHTMLVVDNAAENKMKSSNSYVFMWAALLHDVGKAVSTKIRKGRITSYDHDKLGAVIAKEFLQVFFNDNEFIKKVCSLVRWHMQILFVIKSLPFANVEKMREQCNIYDVALLGLCDRLGRLGIDKKQKKKT